MLAALVALVLAVVLAILLVTNTGNNYEDVESSAEVEQVAEQENEACQGSICENNLAQTQSTGGGAAGGGGDGGDAIATSTGGSTTTATGGAGGAATGGAGGDGEITVVNIGNNYEDVSSSAEVEQVAEQENEACEGSSCENNLVQTQSTGGGAGGGANGGDATAIADDGSTATATGGAGGTGGGGGDGGILMVNEGDNYEDVSSSAEIEQVANRRTKPVKAQVV